MGLFVLILSSNCPQNVLSAKTRVERCRRNRSDVAENGARLTTAAYNRPSQQWETSLESKEMERGYSSRP